MTTGVPHLRALWERARAERSGAKSDATAWERDTTAIYGLGLNLAETFAYLYNDAETFERFEAWVLERNGGAIAPARAERINAAIEGRFAPAQIEASPPPLDARDLAHFDEHGYVIVRSAVPAEDAANAERAIWEFVRADPDDPETWYGDAHGHSIWIPLLRHEAVVKNRSAGKIARAFAQLWGRDDLWTTVDQCGFNPPERAGWQFPGPHLHWDVSLAPPIPFGLHGVLYLTDTPEEQGAFTCVPGFHRRAETWLASLGPGADPRAFDIATLGPKHIAANAGDFIIWHDALPHGSSPNRGTRPRIVQYIAMSPAIPDTRPWI